jgi:Domain of unknown function (DUF397)
MDRITASGGVRAAGPGGQHNGGGSSSRPANRPRARPVRSPERTSMHQMENGMPVSAMPPLRWQKSRRSNPSGNCVEMAELPGGRGIAVRNSRDPEGPALIYTVAEIAAFLAGARDGDFDNLVA